MLVKKNKADPYIPYPLMKQTCGSEILPVYLSTVTEIRLHNAKAVKFPLEIVAQESQIIVGK